MSILAILAASVAASVAQSTGAADPAPQSGALTSTELAAFRDAAFERQFVASYAAETDIEPKLTEPERKSMLEVLKLIQSDKLPDALALLEKSRNDASSATIDFTIANIHFQSERFPQAAEAYEAAVAKFPKFRRAWKNLALIRVREGDFRKALPALTKVIELGGGDAMTYGLLGFAHSGTDNPLAAESAYRMAILLDPATRDWKLGLAKSFFKQNRFADAAAMTGELIKETPDAADLWLLQANAFIGLGQPMKAAQNYEIVERLGKSTLESLNMMGDIYVNEGLYGLATDCYTRAMSRTPRGPAERGVRAAKVLVARGANSDAERLIAKVEEVYGADIREAERKDLLKMKARMAVARGAGDDEARILAEIISIDPLDGEALILLGQYNARKGDAEQAVFMYERAAKLEKFEADAKVRHAQLLVGQGKYGDALPLLRSAQQVKPRENIQQYLEQVERASKQRGS